MSSFSYETEGTRRMARGTPIDQFAKDYLGMNVSFARLSSDGSICGLTAYADTEYIVEELGVKRTIPLRKNQILLDVGFIQYGQVHKLCGKRRFTLAHECAHQILFQMESELQSAYVKKYSARTPSLSGTRRPARTGMNGRPCSRRAIQMPQKKSPCMWYFAVAKIDQL
jgi:hypothetical protein